MARSTWRSIAILPEFLITGFKVAPIPFIGERLDAVLPEWFTQGMNVTFYFGGTSLLIIVGVAMDTVQQVEIAAHHAALRRVHEEDAHPRAPGLAGSGWIATGPDQVEWR